MADSHFNPFNSIVFLTNRVGRLLSKAIRKRMATSDVELLPTHMGVLVDLWLNDGLKQQDLAVSTIKDKGTIARSISFLEKNNIVVRVPDEKDKRNKRIFLTHKGKALKERMVPPAKEVIGEATAGISEKDLETCKRVLMSMYHKLNEQLHLQPNIYGKLTDC